MTFNMTFIVDLHALHIFASNTKNNFLLPHQVDPQNLRYHYMYTCVCMHVCMNVYMHVRMYVTMHYVGMLPHNIILDHYL